MKLHRRTAAVGTGKGKITRAFWDAVADADLTWGEVAGCVADIMRDISIYQVRTERHAPTCDARGDEACGTEECKLRGAE